MKGKVYWITGLSGAGKTTIGNALYYRLKGKTERAVILDGDIMKHIMSGKNVSYSHENRKWRAFQYSQLCKVLSDQGMTVICCTIAMFDEVRDWNRKNINNYTEVFINVNLKILQERDSKGLYNNQEHLREMVGNDTEKVEFPKNPDIVIYNSMSGNVNEYVDRILNCKVEVKSVVDYFTPYWDDIYSKSGITLKSSDFAKFSLKYMETGKKLIDLGCGNGRDSLFFANKGLHVTAVDLSSVAIHQLIKLKGEMPIFAVCDDIVTAKTLFQVDYDYCYTRWVLHSINSIKQEEMFYNVFSALKLHGRFFIEARTINDDIYGLGQEIEKDAFLYNNHYRRFIRYDEIIKQLEYIGFNIILAKESKNYSISNDSNPTLVRIIAERS